MNVTHGMDVDEVEDLGRILRARADRLDHIAQEINRAVYAVHWQGGVATEFGQQHWPSHRVRLQATAQELRGLGQSALNNAREQRQTSTVRGSSGLGGVGVSPSGLGSLTRMLLGAGAIGTGLGLALGRETELTSASREGFVGARGEVRGSTQRGALGLSGSVEAHAGAEGHVGGSISSDGRNIGAEGSVGGSIGVGAALAGAAALGPISANGSASAFAGARADATAGARVGADGVSAHAEMDAFAGAEAQVSGKVSGGGVEATGGASAYAGVGLKADVDAEFGLDRITIGGELGASLGIGAGLKVKVSVSPSEVATKVSRFLHL